MSKPRIKTGDTIKCTDADDLVEVMTDLARTGKETDFLYELNGVRGYFLQVTKGEEE